jgi:hypothetical protein
MSRQHWCPDEQAYIVRLNLQSIDSIGIVEICDRSELGQGGS